MPGFISFVDVEQRCLRPWNPMQFYGQTHFIRPLIIVIFAVNNCCKSSSCGKNIYSLYKMEDASAGQGFKAKEEIVQTLIGMGFSRNAAVKACYYTGNYNADLAAAWIIESTDKNLDGPLEEDLQWEDEDDDDDDEAGFPGDFDMYKMVFVVNTELGMGVGKVAAQVAHAALGIHRMMIDNTEKWGEMMISWEQYGETKIVLKADNAAQLTEMAKQAEAKGLPNYLVQDAGRTQIAAGSQTVLGIMGKIDVVDSITGKLKLL